MSNEFIICLILLFSLSAIGTPIAYAIFVGSCAYLWVGGQGIGLAGKVILDGLYSSFILLAVPLFIVCLLYTSPSPRDTEVSRMPSSA